MLQLHNYAKDHALGINQRHGKGFSLQELISNENYQNWRAARLRAAEAALTGGFVPIESLSSPSESAREQIIERVGAANLALYEAPAEADPREALRVFAETFGLRIAERHRSADGDGIVALTPSDAPAQRGYIPYSSRGMNWHTDGYYNAPEERISAMVLHTVRPARDGGSNQFLDHAIAYIRLRDLDPRFAQALSHPQAMSIPANEEPGSERPESVGPVFYPDPETGALQMRYTARTRSISWRDDPLTAEAVAALREVLERPDPLTISVRFKPGQGVICNNVLHDRTGFDRQTDTQSARLVYRVRFSNRVKGT